MKRLVIIGGGPAALMLAAQIDKAKYTVTLFEKKKAVGRKFLVAGEGGLNLTYDCSVDMLISQYAPSQFMEPMIRQFTNEDLINWFHDRGIQTFIGSSRRVFPDLSLKPIEVLNQIVEYLSTEGVRFSLQQKWTGWNEKGHLCFEETELADYDIVVFALGGASWKVTGSDGLWSAAFEKRGVSVVPFRAANCGFHVKWDQNVIQAHEGKPLKNISLTYKNQTVKGELLISTLGVEGNAIYALSQKIQDALLSEKSTVVYLDLKPTMTVAQIKTKIKKSQLTKPTDILRKDVNLDSASIAVLKQFSSKDTFLTTDLLAETIKRIPIIIHAADKLDKAISTLGGIALEELDDHFQLKKIPKAYVIGEMLDWFAPTGGYLLQACFSMGFALANHLNHRED